MKTLILMLLILPFSIQAQISQGEFAQTINKLIEIYDKDLPTQRVVDINWESETENASVSYKNGKAQFSFHGGFVRNLNLSSDALALVTCHEIGHLIGGYPKVMPTQKYTSEGQSDYFATRTCLKKYFVETDDNNYSLNHIKQELIDKCDNNRFCLRGLAAIRDASVIYSENAHINHKTAHISPYTIFNDYPKGQCRVDTLRAGLFNEKRPSCWFKDFQSDRYEYDEEYIYEEAQAVADITEVTMTSFGCHVRTAYPNVWMGSYFNPLSESELMMKGVNVVGACPYKKGQVISGSMTLFRGSLYLNLRNTDK